MNANDYGMPMNPQPAGTAVSGDTTWLGNPPADDEPPLGVRWPKGLVELKDQAGMMVGDIARTAAGLTIYNAKLKEKVGDGIREFHQPVNVPWSAVLYWSVSNKKDSNDGT